MTEFRTALLLAGAAVAALAVSPAAAQCAGAGIVTRIDGRPQDIAITRAGAPVARPRVLEVVCQGDQIRATGASRAVLSIDGAGRITVDQARPYTVPSRGGRPSVAGNAYRSVSDRVVPDMKRLPWDVRLKGAGSGFEFAQTALTSGGQRVTLGRRDMLVRLNGGEGPYRVELLTEAGASVASAQGEEADLLLRNVNLAEGGYRLRASDAAGNGVEARLAASAEAPPAVADLAELPDAEVRAAVQALELAKTHPAVWAFEAEQMVASAPAEGLDRERVYLLLESYGQEAATASDG